MTPEAATQPGQARNRLGNVPGRPGSRVLFVGSATELGGAETALLELLRHVNREQIWCGYASLEFGEGPMGQRIADLDVPVFRLPRGRLRDLRRTAAKTRALARIIRDQQVDLLVSNTGHPLVVTRPAALFTRRPCAWWVHGYEPNDPLRGEWIALAQRWLSADLLLANSNHTARLLRRDFPNCPPVKLLRPGVDTRRFRPDAAAGRRVRLELNVAPGQPLVGIFGRLQPWKGQHVFLEAASLVAQEFAESRFAVVGASLFGLDREYAEQLRRRAELPDLRGRVLFLGQHAEVNELMNACDAVVHASIEPEPWGLVVAEAMAAGRAVVASAAGGPLEMIEHGRTGMLAPPGDAATLAGVLRGLLWDARAREALGREARLHAQAEFSAERAAAQFTSAMRALRAQSRGAG
jgi:glycosyltransferase involved in cell wall biosynthesis